MLRAVFQAAVPRRESRRARLDLPRHKRAEEAGKPAAARPEDGGDRNPGRRDRPRLQQHHDRGDRLHGARVGRPQPSRSLRRLPAEHQRRLQPGSGADQEPPRLQQKGPGADQQAGVQLDGAQPDRLSGKADRGGYRAGHEAVGQAARHTGGPGADRAGAGQPHHQRPRRHARRGKAVA